MFDKVWGNGWRLGWAGVLAAALLAGCANAPQSRVQQDDLLNRATIHTELGQGYYEHGEVAVALKELDEAIRVDPAYAPAYNMRALVYMHLGQEAQARADFSRALALTPKDAALNNDYGWFLCQHGSPGASIKYFMTAIADPLYATPDKAYVNAGLCALKANDAGRAEQYFTDALERQPDNPQALYHLADLAFRAGRFARASALAHKLLTVSAPTAENLWLAIRIAHAAGDRDTEASAAMLLRSRFAQSPQAQALARGNYQ
ncbi:MAG: type IV pilus biogenesis/stability protein PilW [Betaproteobacteria bacterium]|nr:type IV pilus biogenesis/stability protein PilW [Betaproteobacteria bacterium]